MSAIQEGNNPYIAMAGSAVLSLVVGFCVARYTADYSAQINSQNSVLSAQSAELRTDALDIERLKTAVLNDESGITRLETLAASTQANVNSLVSQFGALRASVDAQTEAFHGVQKQVGDMDHWLRPDPNPRSH